MMATFGKALGVSGAFVAGPEHIIEMLIQNARTYVYTTAMPPMLAAAISESLRTMAEEVWRRQHLNALIHYFKERVNAGETGLRFHSMTPIQPLIIGDNEATEAVSAQLYARGFLVPAIRPPTVPRGSARIRVSLNAMHTEAQVDRLSEALRELLG
jgi:8-amino-7-oxononanoate synthase